MITCEQIINKLKEMAYANENVYAMWLEGSDGLGKTDAYSDVDLWFDIGDAHAEAFLHECVDALSELSLPDSVDEIKHDSGEIFQVNLHLENAPPFLMTDICVQKHSRDRSATAFTENDIAELPLIIFDRGGVITFKEYEPLSKEKVQEIIAKQVTVFSQRARAEKYIYRKQFIEAANKLKEYVIDPVLVLARLIYTPRIWYYGTCHISNHLPTDEVLEIERLFKNNSLEDLLQNFKRAEGLFNKYLGLLGF